MADTTSIEWTRGDDGTPGATWNPVSGCTKVSSGCDHCYAETFYERFNGKGSFATVKLHSDRLAKPLTWRKPRRVFVNSMSDLFHADVPVEFIAEVFAVMAVTPQHTYQILTKRHARMRAVLRSTAFQQQVQIRQRAGVRPTFGFTEAWPLPNVWCGVSVETQQWADIRVPALLDTPAAVRFLSCEPLLGPVDLTAWLPCPAPIGGTPADRCLLDQRPIRGGSPAVGWVIVGGESGRDARPMHPAWARQLRDQCVAASVPFFMKQHGEWVEDKDAAGLLRIPDARDRRTLALHTAGMTALTPDNPFNPWRAGHPNWTAMRRVGKKSAGRELDGRTWDQYPQAVTA